MRLQATVLEIKPKPLYMLGTLTLSPISHHLEARRAAFLFFFFFKLSIFSSPSLFRFDLSFCLKTCQSQIVLTVFSSRHLFGSVVSVWSQVPWITLYKGEYEPLIDRAEKISLHLFSETLKCKMHFRNNTILDIVTV